MISESPVESSANVGGTGKAPPLANPLRAYGQDPSVISAQARAVDILTRDCMAKYGFEDYEAQDYDALERSFFMDDTRLYGITDARTAQQYGYLPPPTASSEGSSRQVAPLYQFTLTGLQPSDNPAQLDLGESPGSVEGQPVPPAGCLGQARLEVTGSVTERPPADAELGHALYNRAWYDSWNSPTTQQAKALWSECMVKSGFDVKDPLDDIPIRTGTKPSNSEIEQALADIACKESTDFIAKANAENVKVAQRYLDENLVALKASKEFNERALAKATAIIDADPGAAPTS